MMNRLNAADCADSLLDRLVDGELEESDRRELLAILETTPDGWRRCAFAFLEAQTWARSLASLPPPASAPIHEDSTPFPLIEGRVSIPRQQPGFGRLVASTLIAFIAGWFASGLHPFDRTTASSHALTANNHDVSSTSPARAGVSTTVPKADTDVVPMLTGKESEVPRVLPDQILWQLERQGYRIQQNTGLMTTQLDDGRRLTVPVDELEFQYVGNQTF